MTYTKQEDLLYNNLILNSTQKRKQLGILLNLKQAEMTKTVMMEI